MRACDGRGARRLDGGVRERAGAVERQGRGRVVEKPTETTANMGRRQGSCTAGHSGRQQEYVVGGAGGRARQNMRDCT